MKQNCFLLFLIFASTSFYSCNSFRKPAIGNTDYDERVANISKYSKTLNHISSNDSTTIYVMQPTKCNVCNSSVLESIKLREKNSKAKTLIVLNGSQLDVEMFFASELNRDNLFIIVDTTQELNKLGFSFFKNIRIVTFKKKIAYWSFWDG